MLGRVLAVAIAAAMVAGAIAIRDRWDEDEREIATGLRLVCATELAMPCADLDKSSGGRLRIDVEPAGTTAARLVSLADGADPGLAGWLVPGPWPQIVAEARSRAGLRPVLSPPGRPLARSPVVFAMWKERADRLATRCGTVDWRCLGNAAGGPGWQELGGPPSWGPVKPALADPRTSATGLVVLGAATAAFFTTTDLSSTDLSESADFGSWLTGLARAVQEYSPPGGAAVQHMLAGGPAVVDVVATVEADAGAGLNGAARRDEVRLIYPAPVSTADVVLAVRPGREGDRVREVVTEDAVEVLVSAGWRRPGQAGNPALPQSSNLPPPGLLDALRAAWQETL